MFILLTRKHITENVSDIYRFCFTFTEFSTIISFCYLKTLWVVSQWQCSDSPWGNTTEHGIFNMEHETKKMKHETQKMKK